MCKIMDREKREAGLPVISVYLVDVMLRLPDIILRVPLQHLDLHGEDPHPTVTLKWISNQRFMPMPEP